MKSALIPSGHHFASLRAAAMLSPSVAQEEEWKGVTQLAFVDGLAACWMQCCPGSRRSSRGSARPSPAGGAFWPMPRRPPIASRTIEKAVGTMARPA